MRHTVHRLNSRGAQAWQLALLSSDSLAQASAAKWNGWRRPNHWEEGSLPGADFGLSLQVYQAGCNHAWVSHGHIPPLSLLGERVSSCSATRTSSVD
jgi:hypothetical protein